MSSTLTNAVAGGAGSHEPTADEARELQQLYDDFATAGMTPLWTQRADLQPASPRPAGVPVKWAWSTLFPLAERAGRLVPVGRGGERRAIALANPGIPGEPYSTATLWAAVQYLGPHETAPAHRHTQTAFRFVVEGEGVWTNVEGDAVAMRPGDLLLTPSWHFHEHHNTSDHPMAWIDGLDIPLVSQLDAGFFEFGPDTLATTATPDRSYSERLWGHPGVRPLVDPPRPASPLMAYRREHTDAALTEQLACERDGVRATVEPGHAAVRFVNPVTGGDALSTIRTEMHRVAAGSTTAATRTVGSSVWQVFSGTGTATVGDEVFELVTGDIFAVPSWAPVSVTAGDDLDLFRFSDEPVYRALGLDRTETVGVSVPDTARTLPWVAAGTDALLARLATVDVAAASGLPGWTHGHVAAHVARNADALGRLLTWARTGVETPMYASPAHRAEEIARDAGRARDVQLADVRWTADALAAAMAGLPQECWAATVRSARGRLIAATELPWMRVKEVWLHAVDLGLATSAIPADVGAALFDDVTAGFVTRDDVPGLRLAPTGGDPVVIGDGATAVAGTPTALVLWLVGRSDGDGLDTGSALPALPSWL